MVFGWISSGWNAVRKVLTKTRDALTQRFQGLLGRTIDESLFEEIEEILFEADLGVMMTKELIKNIKLFAKEHPEATVFDLLAVIETSLISELSLLDSTLHLAPSGPTVILVAGVNGSGKTTTIAKLAQLFTSQGKSVLLAAADTFRAAAQEQLGVWATRLHLPIITSAYQADPASVAFDSCVAVQARGIDVLIVDTAGRLENKHHLLRELEKVRRSCQKSIDGAPHETLLVLDATVGQNGVEQARSFHHAIGVTGLVLTKLDGSARGGVVIAVQKQLNIPVKFLGVGERSEDIAPFDPKEFVHSLFHQPE